MKFQETGRFGRITKNLKKLGFEKEMKDIIFDSNKFNILSKIKQTEYIEKVMIRMQNKIGLANAKKVLFKCGEQCCGNSWTKFSKRIWESSKSIKDFIKKLNIEEEKYNTSFSYNESKKEITVKRSKCICGLINKGKFFKNNKLFCHCSTGHMYAFFNSIFKVKYIKLKKSIYSGDKYCKWIVKIDI